MGPTAPQALITTVKDRCRVCYTCVRECPAKAIRIAGGQAEVQVERCIGCGNCVHVCTQHAKRVFSQVEEISTLLSSEAVVAACVAPSFPAEFPEVDYARFVGMLRALGFDHVFEVGFGADLVAARYRELLATSRTERFVGTTCPAIVAFVEKYHPDLVSALAPIVSPMIATARALRMLHGEDLKVVFIGPCIAKKVEAAESGEIDAALTFAELRYLFRVHGVTPDEVLPMDFEPPHAMLGALFPVSRGMLQAANISEDLVAGEVVAANGRTNFPDAIREFESGDLDARLLEVLCCNGCIMGPGMTQSTPLFRRRSRVSQYVRRVQAKRVRTGTPQYAEELRDLDLSRTFHANDMRIPVPSDDQLGEILARMGKREAVDELNCGACGYDTCREHASAIARGLAESEMCLPYTIDQLRKTVQEVAVSHERLESAQAQLMQTEKLASMGQLAAGIAHEVNNPLGVVLMYAHLLLEECEEDSRLREDLGMIAEQADRCKKIVGGLLNFARQNKVVLQAMALKELVERGMKHLAPPDGVVVRLEHDAGDTTTELDRDQMTQVLNNLVNNAYAAMPDGGELVVRTGGDETSVRFAVKDTGCGIPQENREKIFQPFFTTKQMGKGTGLGLAVTYGIVKMHRGDIRVESNADPAVGPTGTTFTVSLPRRGAQD